MAELINTRSTAIVHVRSVQYLGAAKGWHVEVTHGPHVLKGILVDPFSQDDEEKLRYYFDDYYRVDPFASSAASKAAKSILYYACDILSQLDGILEQVGISLRSTPFELQVVANEEDLSIHRLHWEAVEHQSLGAEIIVCRVCSSSTPEVVEQSRSPETQGLNLLFLTSRRIGADEVDVEYRTVLSSFIDVITKLPEGSGIGFQIVRPGTCNALERCLAEKEPGFYGIVHLDVHGRASNSKNAELLLSDAEDLTALKPISPSSLGSLLKSYGVHTVLLNACESARTDVSIEANLAASLIQAGLSNVVGMSYNLNISAAQIFVREFYQAFLIEHLHIAAATVRGRRALQIHKSRQARFKLKVEIDDWIIPVFYKAKERTDFDNISLTPSPNTRAHEPSVAMISIRDQPIPDSALLGRDNDLVRLEMCLVDNRCIELSGQPGVGSSTLLDHAVLWWMSTKLVNSVRRIDVARASLRGAENIGEWAQEQVLRITDSPNSNALLIIDHADALYDGLDEEETQSVDQVLEGLRTLVRHSVNHYLIVVTSKCPGSYKDYQPFLLRPLDENSALDLFFKLSPTIREKSLTNREDHHLLARFVESLLGNCLALTIVAKYLEGLRSISIKEFVVEAWTGLLHKSHPKLLRTINDSKFSIPIARVLAGASEKGFYLLSSLVLCRERAPFSWFTLWTDGAPKTIALLPPAPDGNARHVTSSAELKENMSRLQLFSLVTSDVNSTHWILHPLLPYYLESSLPSKTIEHARGIFKKDWLERADKWSSFSTDYGSLYWDSTLVENDLQFEQLNFLVAAWISIQDYKQNSIDRLPLNLLKGLLFFHPLGRNVNPKKLASIAALLADTIQPLGSQFYRKKALTVAGRLKATFKGNKRIVQRLHERDECPCSRTTEALISTVWLSTYYRSYNRLSPFRITIYDTMTKLIMQFEKIVKDDAHKKLASGIEITNAARMQLAHALKAQRRFTEAKSMIQVITSSGLTDNLSDEFLRAYCTYFLATTQCNELRLKPSTTTRETKEAETVLVLAVEELERLSGRVAALSGIESFRIYRPAKDDIELLEQDPLLASTVAISKYEYTYNIRQELVPGNRGASTARNEWLIALEGYLENASLEAQAALHSKLAMENSRTGQNLEDTISHIEQAIEVLSEGNYPSTTLARTDMQVQGYNAAVKLKAYEKAYGFLRAAYEQLSFATNDMQHQLMFAIVLRYLYALSRDLPGVFSRFSALELCFQGIALSYTPRLWEHAYKNYPSVSRQDIDAIHDTYQILPSGLSMWELHRETRIREDETKDQADERAAKIVEVLSRVVGCKKQRLSRFLCFHFLPAFGRAIGMELSNLQARGIFDLKIDDSDKVKRVCEEAEKAVFAPREMRTAFVWINKKFERNGLRTRWPTEKKLSFIPDQAKALYS